MTLFSDYIENYINEMICNDCVEGNGYCWPDDIECKFYHDVQDIKEASKDLDFLVNGLTSKVCEPCD